LLFIHKSILSHPKIEGKYANAIIELMKINPLIFKEYDVRGEYPKEINEKIVYKISKGLINFLRLKPKDKIVVGQDRRPSSPKLAEAFIKGIIDSGIDSIDIGAVSTPMLYWSVPFLKAGAGIMVTASHLSKKHNGLKFVKADAKPIGGKDLQKIYKLTNNLQLTTGDKKRGSVKKINIEKDYLEAIYKDFQPSKTKIPHSFDFDADRLIIKDKKGKEFRGDIIGAIIADSFAKKGDIIVYDLRCSRAIPEYFRNKGIKTIPSRVGHFNIKKLMREKKAVFGMELTGHYYFKEFYYCEAPLYGLRKLTEYVAKTKKTLDELARPFMKYAHSGTINIKKQTSNLIKKLKNEYKNASQNFTDGLTVEFSNWWFNIRPSRTEPVTRLVVEAKTLALLEQKKKELLREIKLNR